MSLSNSVHRLEAFLRNDVWAPIQERWSSVDTSKLLEQFSWASVTAWIEHVKDHPPIYGERLTNSNRTEIFVRLPYVGPVTLDVFCFGASAVVFRIYMFWRARRQLIGDNKRYGSSSSNVVKARQAQNKQRFKDSSLQQTIQECQTVKSQLRKVQDPELARKEKKKQLKLNSLKGSSNTGKGGGSGYLGMSDDSLQQARKDLKQVPVKSNYTNIVEFPGNPSKAYRRPLGSKNSYF